MIGTGTDQRSRPSINTARKTIFMSQGLILGTDMVAPTISHPVAISLTTDRLPAHLQDTLTRALVTGATSTDTVLKKARDTITTSHHHIGQVQEAVISIPVISDIDHKDHTLHHLAHPPKQITTDPRDPIQITIGPLDQLFPNPTTIARHLHDPNTIYHSQSFQFHHHTSLQTTIAPIHLTAHTCNPSPHRAEATVGIMSLLSRHHLAQASATWSASLVRLRAIIPSLITIQRTSTRSLQVASFPT